MKNKGFTLIELLAVIVILAIIALIAVPIVLGIINSSKEKSRSLSKELYLKAVDQAITAKNLDEYFKPESCTVNEYGNLICTENGSEVELKVKVDGEKPCGGDIIFEGRKIVKETLNYCEEGNKPDPEPEPESEVPESKSFATDDWSTIIANVKAGNGNVYKDDIGEEKYVTLNGSGFNNQPYTVRLANIESPKDCTYEFFSQTACGFVIEFVDIISEHVMNSSGTNKGGWESSEMRTYLNGESDSVLKALPEELQNGIIETRVVSSHGDGVAGNGSGDQNNFTTIDKLYLLSTQEVWENGSSNTIDNDTARSKTRQLDYYKSNAVTTDSGKYSKAIKKYNSTDTKWWLRAANSNGTPNFYYVKVDGDWASSVSLDYYGVSPAFRLG